MAVLKREEENVVVRGGDVHTLLGKGSEFDGKFSGQIFTKDTLVIGEGARVNAEINAGTVVVNGQVEGNIRATQLIELHNPGRVKGNLETPSLSIDKGVMFEGACKMESMGKTTSGPTPLAPGVAEFPKR